MMSATGFFRPAAAAMAACFPAAVMFATGAPMSTVAVAEPIPQQQLLTPPADARHYTISSTAGKHGDVWSWTTSDGRVAYRMSMSLRGWVTEDDELVDRTGSIAPGKTADIILVDGDVSKDLANLRHVDTVFLDGYRLSGEALRQASGLSGMPK
jgi:hypothetical protein